MRTIYKSGKYMTLHDNGQISHKNWQASEQWRITGAVRFNNFGHEVEYYSLDQILADPSQILWRYKNGKQRVHLTDLDHGTPRTWMNPPHSVY